MNPPPGALPAYPRVSPRREPGDTPLDAMCRLAKRLTCADGVLVFVRLSDGSYMLEHADSRVLPKELLRFNALLPRAERELADGGWLPQDRRCRTRLRDLAAVAGPVAFLGLIRSAPRPPDSSRDLVGALALIGKAKVERRDGLMLADALGAALSYRECAREQVELEGRLRLRVYRLHTIFDMTRRLGGSFRLGTILRALVSTLSEQLEVEKAVVLRPSPTGTQLRVNVFPPTGLGRDLRGQLASLPWQGLLDAGHTVDQRGSSAVDRVFSRLSLRSLYPMDLGGKTEAVIVLSAKEGGEDLTEEDEEFARTLVSHGALALANARLLTTRVARERLLGELQLAKDIQDAILPSDPMVVAGVQAAGRSIPCYEVGGDYLDLLRLPGDRLLVAVGDVAGKGIPAAMLMASVAATIRTLAMSSPLEEKGDLAQMTGQANDLLVRSTAKSRFVSLLLLVIDGATGLVRYVNGGHCPGVAVGRSAFALTEGGMPLGLFSKIAYDEGEGQLEKGDALLLFTDGVDELFTEPAAAETLSRMVRERLPSTAPLLLDHLVSGIVGKVESMPPKDDMTLLCLTRS